MMNLTLTNPRYVVADNSLYDITVDDGTDIFEYTVAQDDQAPMAVAIRAQMTASPISIAAYVAPEQTPQQKYAESLSAGLTIAWTSSDTLNATYSLDQTTQFNLTAEMVSINTNGVFGTGQTSRNWPTLAGQYVKMTVDQFKLFATAVAAYVDQLTEAVQMVANGETPVWPEASVTLTG